MTRRMRSDKPAKTPVERPEPLGGSRPRPSASGTSGTVPGLLVPLTAYRPLYDPDAYPWAPSGADHRALVREERFRARELADLPDTQLEDL